jgi:hypothetical protein
MKYVLVLADSGVWIDTQGRVTGKFMMYYTLNKKYNCNITYDIDDALKFESVKDVVDYTRNYNLSGYYCGRV